MNITRLNIYKRLRDFKVPSSVLDEIFSNDKDLKILEDSFSALVDDGFSEDESAENISKMILKELDIDPDQLINDPEKAAIYAHIMGISNGNQQNTGNRGQQSPMANMGGVPPGASPTDVTGAGGGNIGTGSVPMPGETGFSAAASKPPRGPQT